MTLIKKGEVRNKWGRAGNPKNRTIDVKSKQTARSDGKALIKKDGWENIATKLGTSADATTGSSYRGSYDIHRNELESMYRSNGFAKKIINLPPQEMLREWIEISGDSNGDILKDMAAAKTKRAIAEALKWSRLYGGSLLVAIVDDGSELSEPLNINNIRRIMGFRVYDRYQISWVQGNLVQDPRSMQFGMPDLYRINPYTGGGSFDVHHSRVWRFDGEQLPGRLMYGNQGWGDSVFQAAYEELRQNGTSMRYVENIIRQFEQTTVSVNGLQDMLAADEDDAIIRRFQMMDLTRSILNTVFLDAEGEQFAKHSSAVGGLAELLDRFALQLSGVTGIPATKLFGRSPAGMNATGDSDIRQWYDQIRSDQEDDLREPLEWIKTIICSARRIEPDDYSIVFRPLATPSEEETARTRLTTAQSDQIYFQMGLNAQSILKSRFGGDHYSIETQIEEGEEWFDESSDFETPDPALLNTGGEGDDANEGS